MEDGLDALHRLVGGGDGGALRQVNADEHFGPVGAGKELLLHHGGHAHHAEHQQAYGAPHHGFAVRDAAGHASAQALVQRGLVHVAMRVRGGFFEFGQQLDAQIRRECDRHQPRHHQRISQHPKNVARVFAHARLCKANGHKARDRDQRAKQHGCGGHVPRMAGRAHAVPAFFHLHDHHLDGDDGVVHQQAQRYDERAQGDAVQVDTGDFHEQKREPQRKRHRNAHHQARPKTNGQHTHAHDHQHRDQKLDLKQVDCFGDGVGLVGQDVELHAQRQARLLGRDKGGQPLAKGQAVFTFLHDHAEQQSILPTAAHQVAGRVFIALGDGGNVTQTNQPLAHANGHGGQAFGVRQVGVEPQIGARAVEL